MYALRQMWLLAIVGSIASVLFVVAAPCAEDALLAAAPDARPAAANAPAATASLDDAASDDGGAPAGEDVATLLERGGALEQSGKPEQALAVYLDFIRRDGQAAGVADVLLAAARLHDGLRQQREAEALLTRLIDEHPQCQRLDGALYLRGFVRLELGRSEEATADFLEIHESHRQSAYWAHATYSLAQQQREMQPAQAGETLQTLLDASPGTEWIRRGLLLQAAIALSAHDWDGLRRALGRLCDEHPADPLRPLAEFWLAEADYRTARYDAARQRLAALVTAAGQEDERWRPLVPLRLAQVMAQLGNWQEAQRYAELVLRSYSQFSERYEAEYVLARAYEKQHRADDALAAYRRVAAWPGAQGTETAAMAQWSIGELYFRQGRFDEAIAAYETLERRFAHERWRAAALLQAGKCAESQENWSSAITSYGLVLREHSAAEAAAEAQRRLRVVQQRAGLPMGTETASAAGSSPK